MSTWHIHMEGRVQGVGFRPAVYRMALEHGLKGAVSNENDGVHILVNGTKARIREFCDRILQHPPKLSIITSTRIEQVENREFQAFKISLNHGEGPAKLLITPDLGICEECSTELQDPSNRRADYAFTTCIHCGPRYSIMTSLPYDRERTSMDPFEMCPQCRKEYGDPENRRYYSQTNSCPQCAVKLFFLDKQGGHSTDSSKNIVQHSIQALQNGEILAVKGIGGFLLMADATRADVVRVLRKRKNRPDKPFALLYPDIELLRKDTFLSEKEQDAFLSIESPIVLLRLRPHPHSGIAVDAIAPGLDKIGVMSPYAPLLALLSKGFGKPLIATSGNVSGSPIVFRDERAAEYLGQIADRILSNNRVITSSQDDSVIAFTQSRQIGIYLRRSRGFSPTFMVSSQWKLNQSGLAMGSQLKHSLALSHQGNIYISQYLGNLEHYDCCRRMEETFVQLRDLLSFQADWIAVDTHPDYFASRYGRNMAEKTGLPLLEVQHHKAHAAAVLAENQLLECEAPILCVIWDGTGYGEDGQIWGSEFFLFEKRGFERLTHLPYSVQLAGDKMSREPRLSALSLCGEHGLASGHLSRYFREDEWRWYQKMKQGKPIVRTSSMGRMFDAVASITNLNQQMSYEGQAAMLLEKEGRKFLNSHGLSSITPWQIAGKQGMQEIMSPILESVTSGMPTDEVAARFHLTLTHWIEKVAAGTGVKKIAFSGGVFQNSLMIDLVSILLNDKFDLYFHKKLSPNDESISFGQLASGLFLSPPEKMSSDFKT